MWSISSEELLIQQTTTRSLVIALSIQRLFLLLP
nr:MAG TPA: hypothetical protein [Caudoviricetes sp.]